jgi:probable F420-dependent oxidoreductase
MAYTVSINLPTDLIDPPEEYNTMLALRDLATTADKAGFWSGTVTDHPVPSHRWLDNGGHYAQDPFVMLSMIAAMTTNLRLQTNIIVLPYRNPFITARAVASLDVFSGGRVILGIGAGYLKPEYKALGVDFDSRNELMDEYITAMKLAWTGEDFTFEGTGYTAVGNRMRPTPIQQPHPPLLIGGNSKRALRRTAEMGDAWHPFFVPASVSATARTAELSTDQDLIDSINYMLDHSAKIGRAVPPQTICSATFTVNPGWSAQEAVDHYGHLSDLGVSGSGVSINASGRAEWCDQALKFGADVLPTLC